MPRLDRAALPYHQSHPRTGPPCSRPLRRRTGVLTGGLPGILVFKDLFRLSRTVALLVAVTGIVAITAG